MHAMVLGLPIKTPRCRQLCGIWATPHPPESPGAKLARSAKRARTVESSMLYNSLCSRIVLPQLRARPAYDAEMRLSSRSFYIDSWRRHDGEDMALSAGTLTAGKASNSYTGHIHQSRGRVTATVRQQYLHSELGVSTVEYRCYKGDVLRL
jgi:hypothetical protein